MTFGQKLSSVIHMKVPSCIQVNDVSFQNLLVGVLALQFALWAVMGLNALGWQLTVVHQLIGFVYLTLVPGILILSVLRLYHLRIAEIVVYAVGLSVSVVMSIGFVASVAFNGLNVIKPFSFPAVTSSVSFVVLVLCAIAYFRNRTHPESFFNTKMSVPLTPTLFLCIIPFITVFSTYLVNTYNVDLGQLFLYLILGVVVLLIAFDKIPSKLYSLAVFVIALSLLFQQTLISSWLTGWDIQLEWSLANAVLKTGVWNPNVYNNYASMLSVVVVAPIYSLISNLDLVWVFKLVYPVIFALVPVGLYQIFRRQLNDKLAFLSCFFFMSIAGFSGEMTQLARQEVAELFFVLFILLLVSEEMDKRIQSALLIVIGLSLAVSHYGLTYLLVLFLFVMWLLLTTLPHFRTKVGIHKDKQIIATSPKPPPRSTVTIVFILLLFIASSMWYSYTSSGSVISGVSQTGNNILSSFTELFNPAYSQALNAVTQTRSFTFLHRVNQFINYLNQFLIIAGVCLTIFLKKQRFKLQFSFMVLSTIAIGFLIASLAIPFLGASLDAVRIYQFTSIFLAPFLAIGFIEIGEGTRVTMSKVKSKFGFGNPALVNPSRVTKLLAIYLVLFMLFTMGFIFALTEGFQTIPLNNQVDGMQFNHREIVGATWLVNNSGGLYIYGDEFKPVLINALGGQRAQGQLLPYPHDASAGDFYIFLGSYNIKNNQGLISNLVGVNRQDYYANMTSFSSNKSLIYSNGGAEVYT